MAQLVRPQDHDPSHEQYPQSGEEHGEDQDKKSVLKKVKAKAKKIKDTLKLHGHGHGHDAKGAPDDHDMDEEDDDGDDAMVDDPEVQGAPGYGGAAIRSSVLGQEERPGGDQRKISLEREGPFGTNVGGAPSMKEEVPSAPANTPASMPQQRGGTNPVGGLLRGEEASRGQPELGDRIPAELEEDPHSPKDRSEYRSPSNFEAKETVPTGAGVGEAGNSPIVASFGKMTIEDEPEQEPKEKSSSEPSSDVSGSASPGSYTGKISSATAAIADRAISTKNMISSKLGIGGKQESGSPETQEGQGGIPKTDSGNSDVSGSASPGSYTGKISSATAAIKDRAISTKNVISSKLGIGGKQESGSPETQEGQGGIPKTESENSDVSGSASPGSYTGKISSATAVITDKAISAKNVIASKVGMGEKAEVQEGVSNVQSPGASSDKGGASVKGYFVEKLKPGEEDKALSEVISETLFKKKAEEEKSKPMGKVTESEEVKRHLGSSMEEDQGTRVDTSESSVRIPGVNVLDKLKGAVGSWFGSSTGSDQVLSSASATGEDEAGQKRLQESGN